MFLSKRNTNFLSKNRKFVCQKSNFLPKIGLFFVAKNGLFFCQKFKLQKKVFLSKIGLFLAKIEIEISVQNFYRICTYKWFHFFVENGIFYHENFERSRNFELSELFALLTWRRINKNSVFGGSDKIGIFFFFSNCEIVKFVSSDCIKWIFLSFRNFKSNPNASFITLTAFSRYSSISF